MSGHDLSCPLSRHLTDHPASTRGAVSTNQGWPAASAAASLRPLPTLPRCVQCQRPHPSPLCPVPADLLPQARPPPERPASSPASPAVRGWQALAAPSCGRHLHRQRPAVHLQRPHPLDLISSFYFLVIFFHFLFLFPIFVLYRPLIQGPKV